MRKGILIFISLLATTVGWTQQGEAPKEAAATKKAGATKAKVLKRPELDALLADPEKVLLLDVRRPEEISSIGGFPVYLSIQVGELDKHLAEIPRDRLIVTVSNHAARGGRAADLLANHGFQVAGTIGAETYEAEGGKLVKIAPPDKVETSKK